MDSQAPVTLKIPRPLYNKLQQLVVGTSFRSVTEFVVYILRDLVSSQNAQEQLAKIPATETDPTQLNEREIEMVRRRLKQLGYL
jgi:Arc/MetJ-type ribon-helix-helix transcriptional regulator